MPDSSTALFFAGLAAVVVAARYFLAQPTTSAGQSGSGNTAEASQTNSGRSPAPPREVTEDMVSIVSILVPHIDRAVIRADLEETRSVEATSMRLLEQENQRKQNAGVQTTGQNGVNSTTPTSNDNAPAEKDEKPADWFNDRQQRELHMKQQREKMMAQARQRTLELAKKEQSGL